MANTEKEATTTTSSINYSGIKLTHKNYDQWKAYIEPYLQQHGLLEIIQPDFQPIVRQFPNMPVRDADPDEIELPSMVDDNGAPLSQAMQRTATARYDLLVRQRQDRIKTSLDNYKLAVSQYEKEEKKVNEQSNKIGKALVLIREALSSELQRSYIDITEPKVLWQKLNANHSQRHRNNHDELEKSWTNFSMNPSENMSSYLARFRALVAEVMAAGLSLAGIVDNINPANDTTLSLQKDKVVNGMDYRYVAAAQVCVLKQYDSLHALEQDLFKLGDTTAIVGQRNLKSSSAFFTAKETQILKEAVKKQKSKGKSKIDSNQPKPLKIDTKLKGKYNPSKINPPEKKSQEIKPTRYCIFCGHKHEQGCNPYKCECHTCKNKVIGKAVIGKTNENDDMDEGEFDLDGMSFGNDK